MSTPAERAYRVQIVPIVATDNDGFEVPLRGSLTWRKLGGGEPSLLAKAEGARALPVGESWLEENSGARGELMIDRRLPDSKTEKVRSWISSSVCFIEMIEWMFADQS